MDQAKRLPPPRTGRRGSARMTGARRSPSPRRGPGRSGLGALRDACPAGFAGAPRRAPDRRAVPPEDCPRSGRHDEGRVLVMSSGQRMSLARARAAPWANWWRATTTPSAGCRHGGQLTKQHAEPPKDPSATGRRARGGDRRAPRTRRRPAASGLQRSGDEHAEGSAAASAVPDAPAAEDAAKASRVAETTAGTGDDAAARCRSDAVAGGRPEAAGGRSARGQHRRPTATPSAGTRTGEQA
ncbi:hypothetical protein QJS66_18415 [Kocuria rhizophila]|nr:hypothetical protein QJS66_18415 [Kocuria rhizophila]